MTFAAQALEVVRRTPFVQFFGATTGFIVNYDPDHAIRFDVNGITVELLDHAHRPGEVNSQEDDAGRELLQDFGGDAHGDECLTPTPWGVLSDFEKKGGLGPSRGFGRAFLRDPLTSPIGSPSGLGISGKTL